MVSALVSVLPIILSSQCFSLMKIIASSVAGHPVGLIVGVVVGAVATVLIILAVIGVITLKFCKYELFYSFTDFQFTHRLFGHVHRQQYMVGVRHSCAWCFQCE